MIQLMGCVDVGLDQTRVTMKPRAVVCCFFLHLLILFLFSLSLNRVILGRKVCLAFLAPLATDYKVLK